MCRFKSPPGSYRTLTVCVAGKPAFDNDAFALVDFLARNGVPYKVVTERTQPGVGAPARTITWLVGDAKKVCQILSEW